MNLRSLTLFTHVFGTLLLFSTLVLEWFVLALIRTADTMPPLLSLRALAALPRLTGVAALLILLSGMRLTAGGALRVPWIAVALAAMVIIGVLGAAALRPLRRSIQDPPDSRAEAVAAWKRHASSPFARASLRMRIAAALAIVYLMIGKPALVTSAVIVSLALAIGAVSSVIRSRV